MSSAHLVWAGSATRRECARGLRTGCDSGSFDNLFGGLGELRAHHLVASEAQMAMIRGGGKAVQAWADGPGSEALDKTSKAVGNTVSALDEIEWQGQEAKDFNDKLSPMKANLELSLKRLAKNLNTDLANAINPLLREGGLNEVEFSVKMSNVNPDVGRDVSLDDVVAATDELREAAKTARTNGKTVYSELSGFMQSFRDIPEDSEGGWQMENRSTITTALEKVVMADAQVTEDGTVDGGYAAGIQALMERIAEFLEQTAQNIETASSGMQAGD